VGNPDIAFITWNQAKTICLTNLKKDLSPPEKKAFRNNLGTALQCMGMVLQDKGKIEEALNYLFNALKLKEECGVIQGIANCNLTIGSIYAELENKPKALSYCAKAVKQYEQIEDLEGVAAANHNIGTIYFENNEKDSAAFYFQKTLEVVEKFGDVNGTAYAFNSIGATYAEKDPLKALDYYKKSLRLHESINNAYGISSVLNNIGTAYFKVNNFAEAEKAYQRALSVAREMNHPDNIKNAARELLGLYKKQKKGMEALEMFELYIKMRDTINSKEARKAGVQKELEHQYEKKAAADSLIHAEKTIQEEIRHNEAIKQQRIYTYSGVIGFVLMLLIAGISFRAFKNKQKANEIISEQKLMVEGQKHMIEEKQKEIIDSIMYARRIQRSLLANEKYIQKTILRLKDTNT
jgi:tetratricopeptide (TPR) repeat protein